MSEQAPRAVAGAISLEEALALLKEVMAEPDPRPVGSLVALGGQIIDLQFSQRRMQYATTTFSSDAPQFLYGPLETHITLSVAYDDHEEPKLLKLSAISIDERVGGMRLCGVLTIAHVRLRDRFLGGVIVDADCRGMGQFRIEQEPVASVLDEPGGRRVALRGIPEGDKNG